MKKHEPGGTAYHMPFIAVEAPQRASNCNNLRGTATPRSPSDIIWQVRSFPAGADRNYLLQTWYTYFISSTPIKAFTYAPRLRAFLKDVLYLAVEFRLGRPYYRTSNSKLSELLKRTCLFMKAFILSYTGYIFFFGFFIIKTIKYIKVVYDLYTTKRL